LSFSLISCEEEEFVEPFISPCEQGLGTSSNLISKIPHRLQFKDRIFSISDSNQFLFATLLTGEGPSKNVQFYFYLVDINGQTLWGRGFGVIGQTNFGMFYRDNIFVSGWAQMGNNSESISIIYDLEGNDLKKEIQDEMYFTNFYVNSSSELYLANSSRLSYVNPTNVVKLSPGFDIIERNSLDYPVHTFVANQDGSIVAYYFDEIKKENGVVMVDSQGEEKWKILIPYQDYLPEARLVAINEQKFGLVKEGCKIIPCGIELVYYEFGVNGDLINPGQTISGSMPISMIENSHVDDQEMFYMNLDSKYGNGLEFSYIRDVFVFNEEVLVVFNVRSKKYQGIMVKGTQGSSWEYWWDPALASQIPLKHISMKIKNSELEWKTFCGDAICTFKLDKNLTFNPCF